MVLIAYPFPLLCFLLTLQDPAQKKDHMQKVDHRPKFMPAFHWLPGPRVQMLPARPIYISKRYKQHRLNGVELLNEKSEFCFDRATFITI